MMFFDDVMVFLGDVMVMTSLIDIITITSPKNVAKITSQIFFQFVSSPPSK